jgi:hypothetical protein
LGGLTGGPHQGWRWLGNHSARTRERGAGGRLRRGGGGRLGRATPAGRPKGEGGRPRARPGRGERGAGLGHGGRGRRPKRERRGEENEKWIFPFNLFF